MKSARLSLRITEETDELVRRAAEASSVSVGQFVERAAAAEAERVLADRTAFVLEDEAWDRFVAALDAPPEHRDGLLALLRARRPE